MSQGLLRASPTPGHAGDLCEGRMLAWVLLSPTSPGSIAVLSPALGQRGVTTPQQQGIRAARNTGDPTRCPDHGHTVLTVEVELLVPVLAGFAVPTLSATRIGMASAPGAASHGKPKPNATQCPRWGSWARLWGGSNPHFQPLCVTHAACSRLLWAQHHGGSAWVPLPHPPHHHAAPLTSSRPSRR